MRLAEIDAGTARDLANGRLGQWDAAPGWPHQDTVAGLSFAAHGGLTYLVLDDADRVAGECGTKARADPDGVVEIGYGLAAPARGHGLGTAAVTALLDLLSDRSEVAVVTAEVHTGNLASRRLLERLGFRPDGAAISGYLHLSRPLR